MRSFYVLTATLLASPFVSAQQRKVEVDMRALASLEDALYNLQSSMSVPAGQNVDDANTPQTCSVSLSTASVWCEISLIDWNFQNKDNKCVSYACWEVYASM